MNPTRRVINFANRALNRFPFLWSAFKLLPPIDNRTKALRKIPRNSVGAEIGVWKGDFSERIYYIVSPKKLYLVDPWEYNPSYPARMYGGKIANCQEDMDAIFGAVRRRFHNRPNVIPVQNHSNNFLSGTTDKYLDFVYIDGNHSYDYVLEDLELSKKSIKSGGVIIGDDFFWKDGDGSTPVKYAVETFSEKHSLECVLLGSQYIIQL